MLPCVEWKMFSPVVILLGLTFPQDYVHWKNLLLTFGTSCLFTLLICPFCLSRVWYQQPSTTAAVRTCLGMALTASSMSCLCSYRTRASSRSFWLRTETVRHWRSSLGLEEERKIKTRRMPGRRLLQRLTWQLSWTAGCAPLADRCWPPKTSTPTRPCTSRRARSSPLCSRLAASSASPPFSAFLWSVCHCEANSVLWFWHSHAAASVGKQPLISSGRSRRPSVAKEDGSWCFHFDGD